MKKKLNEKQKMYNTVVKFFDTDFLRGELVPEVLMASVKEFKHAVSSFNDRAVLQKIPSQGVTSDKRRNRRVVGMEGAMLSRMLRSLARKTADTTLFENSKYTRSALRQMKESDLLYQCREIYKTARARQDGLGRLGITEQYLAQIEEHLEAFAAQIVQTRMASVEKSNLSSSMVGNHADAAVILKNQITPLMEIIGETHSDWLESFRQAAKVITQAGTRAMLRGDVLDDSTAKPIIGASVAIAGGSVARISRKFGRVYFRRVEPGTFTLSITCKGYQALEIPDITLADGQMTRVEIRLKKGQNGEEGKAGALNGVVA